MRLTILTLAIVISATFAADAAERESAWKVSEFTDAFTDKRSFIAAAEGSSLEVSSLMVSCDLGGPSKASVAWYGKVRDQIAGDAVPVEWRTGERKAQSETWVTEETNAPDMLILSSKDDQSALVSELISASDSDDIVRVRAPGYYAEFPAFGFSQAWSELLGKCSSESK